jgi:citrate lyase subunit alpha/citrate CoA-transferase
MPTLKLNSRSRSPISPQSSLRGIAINPRRTDLIDAAKGSDLPIRPIEDIKAEVQAMCGGLPAAPRVGEKIVAAIKWVDGTVIDCVREVPG